jgi:hypothetical protein
LKKKKKISGFVFWGSWGVLYPKMIEKFEKNSLVLGGLSIPQALSYFILSLSLSV